jgi:hypothetical protein
MPKSKVRKKTDFTAHSVSRTPVKVKAGPSSVWFVVLFCGLMLIGLVWLMVFQLAATGPAAELDGRTGAVELRRRVCFHDQRVVAHDAVAVGPCATPLCPFAAGDVADSNRCGTRSHACYSSPLWIALVDNPIGRGRYP